MIQTGIINVLDKTVAELIAAGEVVERPASVIKELVENALDAGASKITVEIKNGGTTYMRVTDDGCGIMKDDVRNAFKRHATSKVKFKSDLDSISTLGFRGEALASVCAVSRLQLITRSSTEETGTNYEIHGGTEVSFDCAGCPVGTTLIVRDLFYNVPARAKFLKKDVSEGNAVSSVMDKMALSNPETAFTYIRDGKQVLKTFGDGKLISAIYSVLGRDIASGLIPVDYTLGSVSVSGYISKPQYSRPNRNMQSFFINGRFVRSRTCMAAVEEAFKGSIMVGKFPVCVINLSLPCEITDVNVHPAKTEIRFINERPVFDAVYHAVKSSLLKNDSRKNAVFKNGASAFNEITDSHRFNPFNNAPAIIGREQTAQPQANGASKKPQPAAVNPFDELDLPPSAGQRTANAANKPSVVRESGNPFDIFSRQAVQRAKAREHFAEKSYNHSIASAGSEPSKTEIKQTPSVSVSANDNEDDKKYSDRITSGDDISIKFIGEAFSTYIIAEKNNNEILIIDKHAAHERIIYEKLKSEKAGACAQLLLAPITVTLEKNEYDAAINHQDMFSQCSFEVENFGEGTVIVRAAPQYIDASEVADCVAEMAAYIAEGKNDIFTEKMDWFYHNVACRSAIKAGNKSTSRELAEIVKTLEENPDIRYCPHGRPVCIVMKKSDLERQFGRA